MSKKMDIGTHIMIVGWFNIVASAIFVFLALLGFFFFTGLGIASGDSEAMPILSVVGCAAFMLFGIFAVPGVFAGWGLLTRKPWGRVLGIVVAILDLFNIPIGTAFGIYALWVLTEPEAEAYFAGTQSPRPAPPMS
jgi:hypothetical protein